MFWTERIFVEVLDWIKEEGKESVIYFTQGLLEFCLFGCRSLMQVSASGAYLPLHWAEYYYLWRRWSVNVGSSILGSLQGNTAANNIYLGGRLECTIT